MHLKKIIFILGFIALSSHASEYHEHAASVQEKKELAHNKAKGIKYKIDIPNAPMAPGAKDREMVNSRNKMIFLKEQASIAQRDYESLVVQNKKNKIRDIKADLIKYNISINELY